MSCFRSFAYQRRGTIRRTTDGSRSRVAWRMRDTLHIFVRSIYPTHPFFRIFLTCTLNRENVHRKMTFRQGDAVQGFWTWVLERGRFSPAANTWMKLELSSHPPPRSGATVNSACGPNPSPQSSVLRPRNPQKAADLASLAEVC